MMTPPPEQVRWCALGCGREIVGTEKKCRCGGDTVDLGWRYLNSRGVRQYASTWETLPKEIREAA